MSDESGVPMGWWAITSGVKSGPPSCPPTPPCPWSLESGTQEEPGWRSLPCVAQHVPPGGLGSQWWAEAREAHRLKNWPSIPKSLIIPPVFSSVHLQCWEWKHCNFQKGYNQNGKMPKDVLCKDFLPGYQKEKEEFSSHFLFTSILSVWQEVTTQICSLKDWLQCLVKKLKKKIILYVPFDLLEQPGKQNVGVCL